MVRIAKRHATPNSLLNQMPSIDRLVNYAWYHGAVQLRKATCAFDACLDVTFNLYAHKCVCILVYFTDHGHSVISFSLIL